MPSNQEFYDAIKNISVDADTLNLNTDQVESKLDTTTGLLTTLSADTAIIKADMANGVLVNGSVTANTGLTQPLTDTQLRATAVPVSGTFWPATQPVSLASAPVTPVSDNGASLTVDGSITATQSTAASLKAQAQLLNSAGTVVDYAMTGTAGTPATDVVSVQGIAGATAIPVSGTVTSRIADGAGNNLTSAARGSERALSVQIVDASGAQVTSFGGGGGGGGTVTATQTTPSALKAQAQILDATGSQMSFANAGIAGTPSVDVLTVQGSTSGTPIPVRLSQLLTGTYATTYAFNYTFSQTLANADGNRKALTIFNEGSGLLYIKTQAYGGDTVSTSNYQRRMAAGEYWEVPTAQVTLTHLGIIAGSGVARITTVT